MSNNDQITAEAVLKVRVSKAADIVWEGTATSVSSKNVKGAFDILPYHVNFITYLENGVVEVKAQDGVHDFEFKQAVLHVESNAVHVYTDI